MGGSDGVKESVPGGLGEAIFGLGIGFRSGIGDGDLGVSEARRSSPKAASLELFPESRS